MKSKSDRPPFFSIVIPAYNAECYIYTAIESVLAQTESDWELVIVDDFSRDTTAAILENYSKRDGRIRVFRNSRNLKVAHSLNRGIGLAVGEWIVRLDADDCFNSNYLQTLRSYAISSGSDGFCSSWVTAIDENGKKILDIQLPDAEVVRRMMKVENFLYHPATSFPKKLWEKVGGYPESNPQIAEDTAMWNRFFEHGATLTMLPYFLVNYRLHYSNMTSFKDARLSDTKDGKMLRQNREWRVSLYLKQKMLQSARHEILKIFKTQKSLSPKNIQYFLMTFLPEPFVMFFMWEIRPRLRALFKKTSGDRPCVPAAADEARL